MNPMWSRIQSQNQCYRLSTYKFVGNECNHYGYRKNIEIHALNVIITIPFDKLRILPFYIKIKIGRANAKFGFSY